MGNLRENNAIEEFSKTNESGKEKENLMSRRSFLRLGRDVAIAGFGMDIAAKAKGVKAVWAAGEAPEASKEREIKELVKAYEENLKIIDTIIKKQRDGSLEVTLEDDINHPFFTSGQRRIKEGLSYYGGKEAMWQLELIVKKAGEQGLSAVVMNEVLLSPEYNDWDSYSKYHVFESFSAPALQKGEEKTLDMAHEHLIKQDKYFGLGVSEQDDLFDFYYYGALEAEDAEKLKIARKIPDSFYLGGLLARLDKRSQTAAVLIMEKGAKKALDPKEKKGFYGKNYPLLLLQEYFKDLSHWRHLSDSNKDELLDSSLDESGLYNDLKVRSFWENFWELNGGSYERIEVNENYFLPAALRIFGKNFEYRNFLYKGLDMMDDGGDLKEILGLEELKAKRLERIKASFKYLWEGKLNSDQAYLLDRMKTVTDISAWSQIYKGMGRYLCKVHDINEGDDRISRAVIDKLAEKDPQFIDISNHDWKQKTIDFFKGLGNEELIKLFSYGSTEMYTGIFNVGLNEVAERYRRDGKDFETWVQENVSANQEETINHFLLTLSSRKRLTHFFGFVETKADEDRYKRLCDYIGKSIRRHTAILEQAPFDEQSQVTVSYLLNSVEELVTQDSESIREYAKATILDRESENYYEAALRLLFYQRLSHLFFKELEALKKEEGIRTKEKQLYELIQFMEQVPYDEIVKDNTLRVLVDFAPSAEGYLKELQELMTNGKYGYKKISDEVIEGKVNGIKLEYHLLKDKKGDEFRKIIEEGQYSLVFTRHHSYEGKDFSGVGSDQVLPQLSGTVGTGQGKANDALVIVATEEIAKGYRGNKGGNLTWNEVWSNMGKRISLDNYKEPNSPSFLFNYVAQLKDQRETGAVGQEQKKPERPKKLVIFDGGCGGVNRIPAYISKYKKAIQREFL